MSSNKYVSIESIMSLVSLLDKVFEETAMKINHYNLEPLQDSIAIRERVLFQNPELVKDVQYRGVLSLESAADHLAVIADSFKEPAKTIAPWTCTRGFLESSALAIWFLDPSIDVKTRVGRNFAFRYKGFIEQNKFFRVSGQSEEIERTLLRMKEVEQDASDLGFQIYSKNGETTGIAMRIPGITELINITLDRESDYRLLSGVAHGHHWALSQVGFHDSGKKFEDQSVKLFTKYLNPLFVLYITEIVISSFAKVLLSLWHLYGWNESEIYVLKNKFQDNITHIGKTILANS